MRDPAFRTSRPAAPGAAPTGEGVPPDISAMIRVDHAGELGALRIYQGQLAVLERTVPAQSAVDAIRTMAAQEKRHFDTFATLIAERGVRPTALEPLWHAAGFALGAATALLGPRAAMACTVAVEDVIDRHYSGQIAQLAAGGETALARTLSDFRDDERAHRAEALAHDAEQAPAYTALSAAIRAACRIAIRLSERL